MGAGKPAARHLPVNGQCIAASAVNAEPRLQPRTEATGRPLLYHLFRLSESVRGTPVLIARPSSYTTVFIVRPFSSTSSVALRCAGKPAARHLPVNGQCIAALAADAERASERHAPPPRRHVQRRLGGRSE